MGIMATLRFKPHGLAKIRRLGIAPSNSELAAVLGVDRTTVQRVLRGEPVGIRFVAGAVLAWGVEWFAELFEAVPDEAAERDAAS